MLRIFVNMLNNGGNGNNGYNELCLLQCRRLGQLSSRSVGASNLYIL
jgi:hypothetical protein